MKLLTVLALWAVMAAGAPSIQFLETTRDFGEVPEGRIVNVKYSFRNSGDVPLIVTDVITDCGCTASAFPRYPVEPNALDHISIRFFTKGREGIQQKQIKVRTNGEPHEVLLQLSGKVLSK